MPIESKAKKYINRKHDSQQRENSVLELQRLKSAKITNPDTVGRANTESSEAGRETIKETKRRKCRPTESVSLKSSHARLKAKNYLRSRPDDA